MTSFYIEAVQLYYCVVTVAIFYFYTIHKSPSNTSRFIIRP